MLVLRMLALRGCVHYRIFMLLPLPFLSLSLTSGGTAPWSLLLLLLLLVAIPSAPDIMSMAALMGAARAGAPWR